MQFHSRTGCIRVIRAIRVLSPPSVQAENFLCYPWYLCDTNNHISVAYNLCVRSVLDSLNKLGCSLNGFVVHLALSYLCSNKSEIRKERI